MAHSTQHTERMARRAYGTQSVWYTERMVHRAISFYGKHDKTLLEVAWVSVQKVRLEQPLQCIPCGIYQLFGLCRRGEHS
ncbi:hypothetical protein Spb1_36750 [Planctopirus ephydatiae]|uniref:Uncharacterized protein n=1 Tax=Planctopirus ephydatiae TaxID=2528019 RepID=A0A518GT11_9PLAN|nr:hypothetical protein Spb1_36750 [Planctopirus ephydatiae]